MSTVAQDALTIDQLAAHSGFTTRNIRAYQTRGLLQPPEVHGRRGVYGEEHVARLRLIRDMQGAGFNLAAIKRLLELVPAGAEEEMVRLERALLAPWGTEEPEIVDAAELARRFPSSTSDDVARAEQLGLVTRLEDGRVRIERPSILRAGEEGVELGVPVPETLRVIAEVQRHAEGVARTFVELFLDRVWSPFAEGGRDPSQLPRVRESLERLRPLASSVLQATFQRVMAEQVEAAFEERLVGLADDGASTTP